MSTLLFILHGVQGRDHAVRLDQALRGLAGVRRAEWDEGLGTLEVECDPLAGVEAAVLRAASELGIAAEAQHDAAHVTIPVAGMTCAACQRHVADALAKLDGVHAVRVRLDKAIADVVFNPRAVTRSQMEAAIAQAGYEVGRVRSGMNTALRAAGWLLLIAALYWIVERAGLVTLLAPSTLAQADMGLGALFVVGLTTSVHCVAMCGGICLSQCLKPKAAPSGRGGDALLPALRYNGGRVVSYTITGLLIGALGAVLTLSPTVQGIVKLLAGVFMVAMGLRMLGLFPWLARIMPAMAASPFGQGKSGGRRGPFIVGLLNGLMPCGPLQAMQLYALSTGSALLGASAMLVFGLGTMPLMVGFGALGTAMGRRFSGRLMMAGAVLVAVLGLSMFTQGATLAAVQAPAGAPQAVRAEATQAAQPGATDAAGQEATVATAEAAPVYETPSKAVVQRVSSTLSARAYPSITVEVGTPVEWTITAPRGSINGCNERMILPEYGVEHTFTQGENLITFTPERTGTFLYSCWMGMIRATITVTEAGAEAAQATD